MEVVYEDIIKTDLELATKGVTDYHKNAYYYSKSVIEGYLNKSSSDYLNVKRIVFIGHSLGGSAAQYAFLQTLSHYNSNYGEDFKYIVKDEIPFRLITFNTACLYIPDKDLYLLRVPSRSYLDDLQNKIKELKIGYNFVERDDFVTNYTDEKMKTIATMDMLESIFDLSIYKTFINGVKYLFLYNGNIYGYKIVLDFEPNKGFEPHKLTTSFNPNLDGISKIYNMLNTYNASEYPELNYNEIKNVLWNDNSEYVVIEKSDYTVENDYTGDYSFIFGTNTDNIVQKKYREIYFDYIRKLIDIDAEFIAAEINQIEDDTIFRDKLVNNMVNCKTIMDLTQIGINKDMSKEAIETTIFAGFDVAIGEGGLSFEDELMVSVLKDTFSGIYLAVSATKDPKELDAKVIIDGIIGQINNLWRTVHLTISALLLDAQIEKANETVITREVLVYYYAYEKDLNRMYLELGLSGEKTMLNTIDEIAKKTGYKNGLFFKEYNRSNVLSKVNGYISTIENIAEFIMENEMQVPAPIVLPESGTYSETKFLDITKAVEDSEVVLRYTMDGSEPTESSKHYVKVEMEPDEIRIDKNMTVKVKAFKDGYNPSETVVREYVIGNPSNIEMIYVPAGTTSADNGNITVSQSFYVGKYEVTQSEWESVMTGNSNGISATPSYFGGNPNNPVEGVSWYDVLVYCNRLSIQEGLTPVYSISGSTNPDDWGTVPTSNNSTWDAAIINTSANGYRLPSETEWEYAARGGANGNATTYAGSNTIGDVAWYWDNNTTNGEIYGTKAVGRKQANELGIYDMSGNVLEWTNTQSGSNRFTRGGGWYRSAGNCGVAYRDGGDPYIRGDNIGFRVLRTY